jgi:hypothetical protein
MLMTKYVTVRLIDGSDYPAFACSVPGCHVCFSLQRGFEEVRDGEYRQMVHSPSRHPKCNEHDLYMMLMMPSGGGIYEWACPLKSCEYHRSSPMIKV